MLGSGHLSHLISFVLSLGSQPFSFFVRVLILFPTGTSNLGLIVAIFNHGSDDSSSRTPKHDFLFTLATLGGGRANRVMRHGIQKEQGYVGSNRVMGLTAEGRDRCGPRVVVSFWRRCCSWSGKGLGFFGERGVGRREWMDVEVVPQDWCREEWVLRGDVEGAPVSPQKTLQSEKKIPLPILW